MVTQKEMLAHFLPLLKAGGKRYVKKSLVRAKKATPGLEIVTKTSDGEETTNIASEGDWLVENQTSSNELYLVRSDTFRKKYRLEQSLEKGWGSYQPKGEAMGLKVQQEHLSGLTDSEVLNFEAPWKDSMICRVGDFLVVPPEENEIYRVARKEFEETYQLI